jgi:cell wall-associated NlpC family hydrolase
VSFARQAIKYIAAMVCSTAVVFTSLSLTAPAAQAASSGVSVRTNPAAFNRASSGDLRITVLTRYGESVHVYINRSGKELKTVNSRRAFFSISRDRIPNNKVTGITVKTLRNGEVISTKRFTVHDGPLPRPKTSDGGKIVAVAKDQVGKPYRYGSPGPSSFDCSGLVSYAVKRATGETLPHSSKAQRNEGRKISASAAKPGDLVYTPGHIAIYAGGGKVVEAATPATGVVYRQMWQSNPEFIRL